MAEAHANQAVALDALGRREEAEAALGRALELAPDNPELLFRLGKLLSSQKRFDEAIDRFRQVAALVPDHPAAQRYLAFAPLVSGLGLFSIGMRAEQRCFEAKI